MTHLPRAVPSTLGLLLLLAPLGAQAERAFPAADPESQGLDPQALASLTELVQSFFDDGEIAGAELLVIQNRRTVLHEAIGWKDADERIPMERDTLFNVRSMSKPVTGTLAQMLIDEGRLALEDAASEHLECFAEGESAGILVDHLLTHRSGLPLTCVNRELKSYSGLRALAEQAAAAGLDFEPGSRFGYSDAGSDSLGAILEVVGGAPLAELYQRRIFDPLGMADAAARLEAADPRTPRTASNHMGSKGSWSRYWKPGGEPFYPFAMGSQSVYCTPVDYARFLATWMDGGRVGEERLLSPEAVARAHEPVSEMSYPCGFDGLEVRYGRMWMLWVEPDAPDGESPEAFGHGGSDGTWAVAFPERDLMALYFTQSRGQQTLPTFERALDALILDPDPEKAAALTARIAPEAMRPYPGLYRVEGHDLYVAIVVQDGKLAVELVGVRVLTLAPTDDPDRWTVELMPKQELRFERAESGEITGIHSSGPLAEEYLRRFEPADDLPSVDELVERHLAACSAENLEELGAFRLKGTVTVEARKMEGEIEDLYRGRRQRCLSTRFGETLEQHLAIDGEEVWQMSSVQGRKQQTGIQAEQARLNSLGCLLGDWREDYREVRVLYRLPDVFENEAWVVRTVPHVGPASTKYLDAETGLLLAEDRIALLPGLGMVGAFVKLEDWREVGGARIPFLWTSRAVTPLIGTIVTRYEEVETQLEVAEDAFRIPEEDDD